MARPFKTTPMTSNQWRMLSWPYGTILVPAMKIQTMTCVPLEKTRGVGFRGTWQREQQITGTHIHCLPLLPVQFIQLLKLSVTKICHGAVSMVAQNRNEAINALIWQHATKETHSGLHSWLISVMGQTLSNLPFKS